MLGESAQYIPAPFPAHLLSEFSGGLAVLTTCKLGQLSYASVRLVQAKFLRCYSKATKVTNILPSEGRVEYPI